MGSKMIQRVRYREDYDKPPVPMENDKVYKVAFQPMQTSNYFAPGHRLRIEVSSSNFPLFDRNLNTDGDNFNESKGIVAENEVHHSTELPSSITLSVVRRYVCKPGLFCSGRWRDTCSRSGSPGRLTKFT
jgi:predicted acyl esterase